MRPEPSDLWDVANDEGYGASRGTLEYAASSAAAFAFGAEWGAGWMAAIIGMAEAIRDRYSCELCGGLEPLAQGVCRICSLWPPR